MSPNFIDIKLDFSDKSFLNLNGINPILGGVSPLLKIYKNINWLKPSNFNKTYDDNINAYFIDIGDGIKRTAVYFKLYELDIDLDFLHIMYGDYFKLRSVNNTILSIDFAGLATIEHIKEILSCSNVKYVFCSDHDAWASEIFLKRHSMERIIIWHSPELVRLYTNGNSHIIYNTNYVIANKIVIGAGDLLAASIISELYDVNFEKITVEFMHEVIHFATSIVKKRCFF